MRRLVLEVTDKELIKVGINLPSSGQIKSMILLYLLRQDHEEFAAISKVVLKDPTAKIEDMLVGEYLIEVQVLERCKNGTYTVFIRARPIASSALDFVGINGGYLFTPIGIEDKKIKLCFLGSELQIKNFFERINVLGIRYRVVLLTDANFSTNSPLSQLTQKQREVLVAAYKLGYYDIPRKITSEELARKLNLVDSTVVEHLRKAERQLITYMLEE